MSKSAYANNSSTIRYEMPSRIIMFQFKLNRDVVPQTRMMLMITANQVVYWLSEVLEGEDGLGSGSHAQLTFPGLIVIGAVNIRFTKRSGPYLYCCPTLASGHRP